MGVVLAVLVFLLIAPPAAGSPPGWRWPTDGPVTSSFRYSAQVPFARGQRRGIVIAAPRGTPVRAVCGGEVRFAGTAGANGRSVTVRCGAYSTTYLRLSSIAIRRGDGIRRGERLGRAGRPGLGFGVRVTARRWAYVDPLSLLPPRPVTRGAPLLGPAPRAERRRTAPPPRPTATPRAVPDERPRAVHSTLPITAWLGLFATACGLVGVPLVRVRSRRRSGRAVAGSHAPT